MAKTLKHIHILGIAGVMTAPLALALKKQGYFITGSDQKNIYPPTSDLIASIPINHTAISNDIDLAIIGSSYSSFTRCLDEFDQIKKLNIPYISATNYLAQNLIKTNSVLVAGSYGKTTVSALIAWILEKCHYSPNYFFGGQLSDNRSSLKITNSDWSVVEADESINGLDTKAKFLYYPVKYLILTSVDWEHQESYPSAETNFQAYRQLIEKVPKDGLIIHNGQDPEINKIIGYSRAKTIDYQTGKIFKTKLIGQYNQQNISAAFTLCRELNINQSSTLNAISTFPGIKRRLELICQKNNILIFDDFAQSAHRIKSALKALKYSYPNYHLKVYFEAHATFLQNPGSLKDFSEIVPLIDDFVLGKISFSARLSADKRITAKDWQKIFTDKFHYLPTNDQIISYFSASLKPGDLLVHFSSGGLDGFNNLKKVYNHIKL